VREQVRICEPTCFLAACRTSYPPSGGRFFHVFVGLSGRLLRLDLRVSVGLQLLDRLSKADAFGPVIFACRSENGMPRLCETWTAATNWPKFLKPLASVFKLWRAFGPERPKMPSSLAVRCELWSRTLPGFLLAIIDEVAWSPWWGPRRIAGVFGEPCIPDIPPPGMRHLGRGHVARKQTRCPDTGLRAE